MGAHHCCRLLHAFLFAGFCVHWTLLCCLLCCLTQTFAVAISMPAGVAVVMLLIWHIRMVRHNKTTIEHAEVCIRAVCHCEGLWMKGVHAPCRCGRPQQTGLPVQPGVRLVRLASLWHCPSAAGTMSPLQRGLLLCVTLHDMASVLAALRLQGVTAQIKSGMLGQDRQRHPYDLGCADNLHEILGDNAAMWCVPTCQPTPGGLTYTTTFDKRARDYFSF